MHTHALADDLRPRRSLWLSRRARWSAAIGIVAVLALVVFGVVYRLHQQPYAFDPLAKIASVAYTGEVGGAGSRAYLDGGRAFLGHPTADGRFDLRAVDVDRPDGTAIWTNTTLTDVDTFRGARGSVLVTGLPDKAGHRRIILLNASNGVPFATFDVHTDDAWVLLGRYFIRYRNDNHKLVVTDVGTLKEIVAFDQPGGPRSWWLTDNWSGQQVPTSVDGDHLDEPLTVDPHIVRATADRGLEVVSLSTGKATATAAATGIAGPDDLVYPYEEQVFVADGRPGFQLRAFDRARLTKPQWSWSPPDEKSEPAFVTVCGEHRVCVGEQYSVTALDTRTGAVAFRLDVEHPAHLQPVGDRLTLRHDGAEGPQSSLVDAAGRIMRSWPDKRATRLDEGSLLLLPAGSPGAGAFPWLGVQAESGATRDLGTLDVRLDSCTWSHKFLACAAPGEFVFYRVRSPWYSGRL